MSAVEIRRQARLAGALYVLMALPGAFFLEYVPRQLVARGDPAATAAQLLSSEPLFRLGLAAEILSALVFPFTGFALYRLFKGVDRERATLMVIFVLLSIPISLLTVLTETGAFTLARGPEYLGVYSRDQLNAAALFLMGVHSQAIGVAEFFWGLWLVPLGALVYASGFAPRAIGGLLVAAGVAYTTAAFVSFVVPGYATLVSTVALVPEGLGEGTFVIWCFATRTKASVELRGVEPLTS